jgi:hypothetical protein
MFYFAYPDLKHFAILVPAVSKSFKAFALPTLLKNNQMANSK